MNLLQSYDNIHVKGYFERRLNNAERRINLNTSELSELVNLHGKAVYGFCRQLAKSRADTDDLYQETFLRALELCEKIDLNNNPKAFLISIAAKLWKNNRRKYAWRKRIAPTEELKDEGCSDYMFKNEATPEDVVIHNELRAIVQNAADTLSDKLKVPLYMYYTAGMSNEDIASSLKIPLGTVKSRLHKARLALKKFLEVNEYEKT